MSTGPIVLSAPVSFFPCPPPKFSVGSPLSWRKALKVTVYIILENGRGATQGELLLWGRVLPGAGGRGQPGTVQPPQGQLCAMSG